MTNNLMPWIVLALAVLVSLWWKGYLKMPARAQPPAPPVASATDPVHTNARAYPDLAAMTSHELGLLMATAARREAEVEVAGKIAKEAAEKVKAAFTAPFSPAGEPAPATPATPGV